MADNNFPSVQVIERPFQQNTLNTVNATAFGAFIGKANQGPTTPTRVGSWRRFLALYGTTYTDLHYAVSDFFANGGELCYIQRVVASGATGSHVDVFASDAPADPQNPGQVLPGTPPLFTVEALNPGAWGNQLFLTVSARDQVNRRFDLSLFRVPTTTTFDASRRNSEFLVESWQDLSLDVSDGRYIYDIVNAPSSVGSTTVRIYGQSYDPAQPTVRPYPSAVGGRQLVGGVDGSYVSAGFVSTTAYQSAIDQMTSIPGPYVLNIPNMSSSDVLRYAISSATARRDVFVVIDTPIGKTAAEAAAFANTDLGLGSIGTDQPSFGAVYWPWVYLPAIGSSVTGKATLRAPGGALVGMYMANDAATGPWRTPAGTGARLAGAQALERTITDIDLGTLHGNSVNAIRSIPGVGIVVWGGRTLKKSGKDMYIGVRRSMIYIVESAKRLTQFAVFENNDQLLWQDISSRLNSFLSSVWARGGLKGATTAEAFFVRCDASNNTPTTGDAGQVNVEIGVAFQTPAEFIIISIGQFDGGTNVSVTHI